MPDAGLASACRSAVKVYLRLSMTAVISVWVEGHCVTGGVPELSPPSPATLANRRREVVGGLSRNSVG
jgi:hypothetical protein